MLSLSWCESHFILPLGILLSVGAVFVTCSENKDDYSFIGKMESKVNGCGPSAEGRWKVCNSEFISSLCTNAPKPFLVLIWVRLNWCKERFTTNLLPQSLSRFPVTIGEFYTGSGFPIGHISRYCVGWNRKNPLEYMEVQLLDSIPARMRQQPENVDHL